MKALLINPPTGLFVREDRCQSAVGDFAVSFLRPPHDLMLIASSIRDIGAKCTIKDYPVEKKTWLDFKNDLYDFSPDILILSVTTPSLEEDLKACKIAKEINPKITTIAKGAHFNLDDSAILRDYNELDIVVRNESFLTVKEIILHRKPEDIKGITFRYNEKIIRNPDIDFLEDLDKLPIPARELINNNLYLRPDTRQPMAVIETARGCPYECIFCLASQVSGRKIRKRTPQAIVSEIEDCIGNFNIRNFHFKSDTFTCDKEWVKTLCREMIKRDLAIEWICNSRVDTIDEELASLMKKAGCFAIGFGVESANQMILDRIKKGTTPEEAKRAIALCKNVGILSYAYFMVGFPWDTRETVSDSIRFAIETNPDFVDFFIAYPFPGTALEEIVRNEGLLKSNLANIKAYAMPTLKTYKLSEAELHKMRKLALRKFYLRPHYIARTLLKAGSFGKIRNYLREGSRVFLNVLYGE